MQSGRYDHRTAVNIKARLETMGVPMFSESVAIENISNQGARVLTHRAFEPHDTVVLTETIGDVSVDAEVIYCQRLSRGQCAVGLKFRRPFLDIPTVGPLGWLASSRKGS
jgi:hypothetical protein